MANTAGKSRSTTAWIEAAWPGTAREGHGPRATSHTRATPRAGSRAAQSNRAVARSRGVVRWSRMRSDCAPTPVRATAMPKKTMKNCGWSRKLLRQQTSATAPVLTRATMRSPLGDRRTRSGSLPSGKSTTAQT